MVWVLISWAMPQKQTRQQQNLEVIQFVQYLKYLKTRLICSQLVKTPIRVQQWAITLQYIKKYQENNKRMLWRSCKDLTWNRKTILWSLTLS